MNFGINVSEIILLLVRSDSCVNCFGLQFMKGWLLNEELVYSSSTNEFGRVFYTNICSRQYLTFSEVGRIT